MQADSYALYAISHGIDGWYDKKKGYYMIVNRGAITASSTSKKTINENFFGFSYESWTEAADA